MPPVPSTDSAAATAPRPRAIGEAAEVALAASCGLLAAVTAVIACAAAGLAMGRAVSAGDLLAGAAAGVATPVLAALARDRSRRGLALASSALALSGAIVALALLVAPWRYDTSFDGVGYHQVAVLELARGWNPWRSPGLPRPHYSPDVLLYFPKGAWIVEAAIFRLTGRLETAKALHFVLLGASGLAAFAALRAVRLGPAASAVAGALAALNPVALCQAFTFYVDGLLASASTALVALAVVALVRRDRLALLGAACATVVLVDVKLTGLPYAAAAWAGVAAAALASSGWRAAVRLAGAGGLACAIAMVFTGYNPYVTNTRVGGHPLYPAAGPHARNFVQASRPVGFDDMTRLERVFRSIFSASSTDEPDRRPRLKLPFMVRGDEATKFHAPDVRVGGLGPLFGGALLVAVLALLAAAAAPGALAAAAAALAVAGSALITGEGWWARLAPQLWVVPLILAVPGLAARRRVPRAAAAVVLVAMVADVALVEVNQLGRNRAGQAAIRAQLTALRAAGPIQVDLGPHWTIGQRLTEAGVRWEPVAELRCSAPAPLAGTFFARACPRPEVVGGR